MADDQKIYMKPYSLWRISRLSSTHMIREVTDSIGLTYCNKSVNSEEPRAEFRGIPDGKEWTWVTCQKCFSARFESLKQEWLYDTRHLSNPSKITAHPAYQKIIAMGVRTLPLIFADLEFCGPVWWWEALRRLTQANPVTLDMTGDQEKIRKAWLNWWKQHKIQG